MRDTSPDFERLYLRILLKRSGEERLKMGCSMHATAQALIRAAVLARNSKASTAELRQGLFQRFYSDDFDQEAREKILARLKLG
jgi:hypothetical protein